MKARVGIIAATMFIAAGCATMQPAAPVEQRIWPIEETGWDFYTPTTTIYTREKADAVIQNTQPHITAFQRAISQTSKINGLIARAVNVTVDKEAIKFVWQWTETVREKTRSTVDTKTDKDTSGAVVRDILKRKGLANLLADSIAGGNMDNTTSTSESYTDRQADRQGTSIVPFEDILFIRNITDVTEEHAFYAVAMYLKNGHYIPILIDNDYDRRKFANAVYSAMRVRGYDTKVRLGLSFQNLTPEEKNNSTIQNGVVISGIDKDSPAALAGLRYLDIISAFNGAPVNIVKDLANCTMNLKRGRTYTVNIIRWERAGDQVNKQSLTIKILPQ